MSGSVLGRQSLIELLSASPPLVEGMTNPGEQIQPNGIDLTLAKVALLSTQGRIGVSNQERVLSDVAPLWFDGLGDMELPAGSYLVTFNEAVHLPRNVMALGRTRSSLLRCGVSLHTAVWDAGYSGRSQSLMVVYNVNGFRLKQNARLMQLVFFRLTEEVDEGYNGIFQGENL